MLFLFVGNVLVKIPQRGYATFGLIDSVIFIRVDLSTDSAISIVLLNNKIALTHREDILLL